MEKVRDLTRKAEQAKRAEQKSLARAVKRIRQIMKDHGISLAQLGGASIGGATSVNKAAKRRLSPTDGRLKVKPKYRHPKSKETWSGRGKTPRWLATELKNGKRAEDFLIKTK